MRFPGLASATVVRASRSPFFGSAPAPSHRLSGGLGGLSAGTVPSVGASGRRCRDAWFCRTGRRSKWPMRRTSRCIRHRPADSGHGRWHRPRRPAPLPSTFPADGLSADRTALQVPQRCSARRRRATLDAPSRRAAPPRPGSTHPERSRSHRLVKPPGRFGTAEPSSSALMSFAFSRSGAFEACRTPTCCDMNESYLRAFGNPQHRVTSRVVRYETESYLITRALDETLDPLIDETVAGKEGPAAIDALLRLTMIDPACGSGHFLL